VDEVDRVEPEALALALLEELDASSGDEERR